MKQSQTHEIGEFSYKVDQLGGSASFDLLLDVFKTLGPSLSPLAVAFFEGVTSGKSDEVPSEFFKDGDKGDDAEGSNALENLDVEKILNSFLSAIDKQTLREIVRQLASVTTIVDVGPMCGPKGTFTGGNYEMHFARVGQLQHIKWLGLALKTQFQDFFAAFAKLTADAESK